MANYNQGEEKVQGNDVAIKRWNPSGRVQGLTKDFRPNIPHREMEAGHPLAYSNGQTSTSRF